MTLRKITNDNSKKYISKVDHSHSEKTAVLQKVNQTREGRMLLAINFPKKK